MVKIRLEYVWLDGSEPQKLRSKTKIVDFNPANSFKRLEDFPIWSFDGSSTLQTVGEKSGNTDCLLKPVYYIPDPFYYPGNGIIVLCEVLNPDGTPHSSNKRHLLKNRLSEMNMLDDEIPFEYSNWFGWEQEYTLTHKPENKYQSGNDMPISFTPDSFPRPQGDYYCGVGADNVIGRNIATEHMNLCMAAGLEISGINAEVMIGQWEYQIGPVSPLHGSDQLWLSRYILQRVAEKYEVNISFHPKPVEGDWNGSGCHVNFSTREMREEGGLNVILETMEILKRNHKEHIEVYGIDNHMRMTGKHETSNINKFTYGFSTRDTSIRIPAQTKIDGMGYFEDRRPASNCDPYLVSNRMIQTVYSDSLVEA